MGANDVVICFSHLRWTVPCQRAHQVLKEAARERHVYFVEEPVLHGDRPRLELHFTDDGVVVVRPFLPPGTDNLLVPRRVSDLLVEVLFGVAQIKDYVLWFCTPMAMPVAREMRPNAVIYDLGGDLPDFDEGVIGLAAYHTQLLAAADVVIDDSSAITWGEIAAALETQLEAA